MSGESSANRRRGETANGCVAGNAPLSVRAAKGVVAEAGKAPADADLELCQALVDACRASADYQEGQRAFGEKRKPRFEGR